MDQQTEKKGKKADGATKPDGDDARKIEGGVRLKNVHYAGAGYTLKESELGPRVSFSDKDGQEQLVTPQQAEYLLGKKYRRQRDNGRTTDESRFARA